MVGNKEKMGKLGGVGSLYPLMGIWGIKMQDNAGQNTKNIRKSRTMQYNAGH